IARRADRRPDRVGITQRHRSAADDRARSFVVLLAHLSRIGRSRTCDRREDNERSIRRSHEVEMKKLMLALFCLPLIAATPKPPQTPDVPRTSESIEVSIVNVDVFVTDKAGNRIKGLTKDDFQIYESGKTQPITNFSEYVSDVSNERVSTEGEPAPVAQN